MSRFWLFASWLFCSSCNLNTKEETVNKDFSRHKNEVNTINKFTFNKADPVVTFSSPQKLRAYRNFQKGIKYKISGVFSGFWFWDPNDLSSKDNTGTIIVTSNGKRIKRIYSGPANIDWFGAISGNKSFDNSFVIQNALRSVKNIFFTAHSKYYIKKQILLTRCNNLILDMTGSTIININYDSKTILFDHCNNVTLKGGILTRPIVPNIQNNKDQHTVNFIGCKDVKVSNMTILNSPETGICLMNVINADIINNKIEHTLRDGIYSHYSFNLKYIGNKLSFIKDDALSIHDYGKLEEKPELIKAGHQQAGFSLISKNIIFNAIQGISSIGCSSLVIENNVITRTANAGIAVFNSEQLASGKTARVNNIKIKNNRLIDCGDTVKVNGIIVRNGGQLSSGRAALYIACNSNGADQRFMDSKLRLSKIVVAGNYVFNSGVNGALFYNVDDLSVMSNKFVNCHSNTTNAPQFTGNIVEMFNCTKVSVYANEVLDTRKQPLHDSSYLIDNSSGKFSKGKTKGWRSFEIKITNSPNLLLN